MVRHLLACNQSVRCCLVSKKQKTPRYAGFSRSCLGLQTKVSAVFGDKAGLVGWGVFFWVDRADWASWDASAAINALVWVNEELIVTFIDALDWANLNAGAVFCSDAGLSDNVSHVVSSLVLTKV
jgi:hypothetical protein